jgi:pimeloyl-ACP methyl ester carboxylesterase
MSPLVLLHGASGNAATWADTVPAWTAAGLQPVALDLPGRGDAPGPALDSVAALADWLRAECGRRGLSRPVVVGHSLGGAVAQQLALSAGDALGGVVLVSTSARLRVSPLILEAVAGATAEAPLRLDFAFGDDTPPAVVDRYHAAAAATPPAAAVADWHACDGFDLRAQLAPPGCPVLVVHGEADRLTPPKHQAGLAAALAADRVTLGGVGHMLPWEAPGALARAVAGWRVGAAQ